jgi:hypothetical protein
MPNKKCGQWGAEASSISNVPHYSLSLFKTTIKKKATRFSFASRFSGIQWYNSDLEANKHITYDQANLKKLRENEALHIF